MNNRMKYIKNSFDAFLNEIRNAKTERIQNNRFVEMLKFKMQQQESYPELANEIDSLYEEYKLRFKKAVGASK